jgi:hypothetical protein
VRFRSKRALVALGAAIVTVAIVFQAGIVGASTGPGKFVTKQKSSPGTFRAATAPVTPSASEYGNGSKAKCFGIYPATGAASYQNGCYGHDEPMIDPISNVPGSAQNVTWTFRLPKSSSSRSLLDLGPTFWVGATMSDPSSLANSVFSELQFYPDSKLLPQTGNDINTACTKLGFNVTPAANTWSICDFAWGLYSTPQGFAETPAFVGVVDTSTNANQPLYLHSGDVIKVHVFSPAGGGAARQVITDVTTGQTGSLTMISNATTGAGSVANPNTGDGPLRLPYSTNTTNNAMPWGVVLGTPMALSWEIGHSNFYQHPFQAECVPGQWDCQSYDTSNSGWGAVTPFKLMSVTFEAKGQQVTPQSFATNDGEGGVFEDDEWCGGFGPSETGTTLCSFPYYTYNSSTKTVDLGTSYPGTEFDYGGAEAQYTQEPTCPGPLTDEFGFDYYCDTTLSPRPPIR